ncbi:MAG TPA: hypothetical protein VHB79_36825 [Polyangiaceae bacterium]|nr:hypothetical protein [Polyangiaceae bacterium]
MDSSRSGRRALIATTVSLSATFACVLSLGCSSNGSSFGSGTGGSGMGPDPTNTVGGSDTNTTNAMGGSSSNTTQAVGGSTQANGGTGEPVAGSSSGGSGTTGGDGAQGGQVNMGGMGGSGGGAGPVCPKPMVAGQPAPICHEFLANDNSRNQVNYVNEFTSTNPGGVVWVKPVGHGQTAPENSPRTIEIVDNPKGTNGKAILVSVNDGYVELDMMTGNKLADVTVQFTGVTGACRMPDGQTALGTNASIRIVNASGVQSRSFNLPAGNNLRAINRDKATGDFWLSKTETVYQISDSGQVKWQGFMGAGTKGYAVWWRDGGGMYGTTGEPHTVVELDAAGKILQTTGGDAPQFASLKLDFFSGFVRRPNGNYIVANWLGHQGTPAQDTPEIIEFQPDANGGKAIWTWGNQTLARQITNVYVFQ